MRRVEGSNLYASAFYLGKRFGRPLKWVKACCDIWFKHFDKSENFMVVFRIYLEEKCCFDLSVQFNCLLSFFFQKESTECHRQIHGPVENEMLLESFVQKSLLSRLFNFQLVDWCWVIRTLDVVVNAITKCNSIEIVDENADWSSQQSKF